MIIGKYTPEELAINFNQNGEDLRLHNLLVDLSDRAAAGEVLSEIEKEFICIFLKTAQGSTPPFNTSEICSTFNFKYKYYTYGNDLSGGSAYEKPYGTELKQVPIAEATKELKDLKDLALAWEAVMMDKANADRLVLEAIKEYEFDLKKVQKASAEFQSNFTFGGRNRYEYDVQATLLNNKFVYLTAKEVFENFDANNLEFSLNGKRVIINEFSIIHITNRHFGQMLKRHKSLKSFHGVNFHPKFMNLKLVDIFGQIEQSGGLNAATIKEVNFTFNGVIYRIYTTDRPGHIGDVYLSTFFPLEDPAQIAILNSDFNLMKINNELQVYQPK